MTQNGDISKGQTCGDWVLDKRIGRGGNGQVWIAKNKAGSEVAIKLLTKTKNVAHSRFVDEVNIMTTCDVEGVVPIFESYLPDFTSDERPWYAMPLGETLTTNIDKKSLKDKVEVFHRIASSLVELHEKSITHRDIKPANIIVIKGSAYLGDFGLVDYPDKDDLTMVREELGPRWTMAPEIRRVDKIEDTRPADVYSLLKSLWITITGVTQGFEGRYDGSPGVSIKSHAPLEFTEPLEQLLTDSTEHEPELRPSMKDVRDRLANWIDIQSDFEKRNPQEWSHAKSRVFPLCTPTRATWTNASDIVKVLNTIGAKTNLNHLFFPNGGGLDLEHAELSQREEGCIELTNNGSLSLLKPSELHFESFGPDEQWDYFRLECAPLEPSGVYSNVSEYEEVLDLGNTNYIERSYWDHGEYNNLPLPESARTLSRFFSGAFVIFQKSSAYNRNSGTYDARHSKMTSEEFRQYISNIVTGLANRT